MGPVDRISGHVLAHGTRQGLFEGGDGRLAAGELPQAGPRPAALTVKLAPSCLVESPPVPVEVVGGAPRLPDGRVELRLAGPGGHGSSPRAATGLARTFESYTKVVLDGGTVVERLVRVGERSD